MDKKIKTEKLLKPKFKKGDFVVINEEFFKKHMNEIKWDNLHNVIGFQLDNILDIPLHIEMVLVFSNAQFKHLNRINYIVNHNNKTIQLHELWVKSYEFINNSDFELD